MKSGKMGSILPPKLTKCTPTKGTQASNSVTKPFVSRTDRCILVPSTLNENLPDHIPIQDPQVNTTDHL